MSVFVWRDQLSLALTSVSERTILRFDDKTVCWGLSVDTEPNSADVATARERVAATNPSTLADAQEEIARLRRELAVERAARSPDGKSSLILTESDSANRSALLEVMLEIVPVGVVLADANGRVTHGNSWVERNLRHPVLYSIDTASYGEWVSFHADGRQVQSHEYPLSRVIKDDEDHSELDVHYRRGDGTMFWMRIICEPVRNADGEKIGATVALIDIDNEVRLIETKEVLLGEVNHRVKNSLQLVGSILSLQARSAPNEAATLLQAASARVQAISSVHAALYHDDDVRTVDFRGYLHRFCTRLADALGAGERGISVKIDAEPLSISADKAVPLSLIINELVTNSFKYAFTDDMTRRDGEDRQASITVRLASDSDGAFVVEVSDNGIGAGTESASELLSNNRKGRSEPSTGLGTTLINVLARQLNATIETKQADGWHVKLRFAP